MFFIGPIEEFSKLAALFILYKYLIKKQLNEPVDGLVYISCVALGFSIIENYFYAIKSKELYDLIFIRALIATPMHLIFSMMMGAAFYSYMAENSGYKKLLFTFFIASIIHGLYDAILFNQFSIFLLVIIIGLNAKELKNLLENSNARSSFRKSLTEFIQSYQNSRFESGLECINCGSKSLKLTYKLDSITIQKCNNCDYYIAPESSIFRIFLHFGSCFRDMTKYFYSTGIKNKKFAVLLYENRIDESKKIGIFDLKNFSNYLDKLNDFIKVADIDSNLSKIKPDSITFPEDDLSEDEILENTYKVLNLGKKKEISIHKQIKCYYSILEKLPSEIECHHCLNTIIINDEEIEKRNIRCCECNKQIDYTYDSEFASFFDNDESTIEKPKITFFQKANVSNIENRTKKYQVKKVLPKTIHCPECAKIIEQSDEQKINRYIICANCESEFDISYIEK
jgi:transcription elongation factor Elf1